MAGPSVTELEEKYVLDALRNGWYGKDAYYYVEKFENEFAKYHSRQFGLMTPNCTTALHLLLSGLGVGQDDEVIVPDCTWIGSVAGITYLGAKTVFADIDPIHWCLTVDTIKKCVTPKTKAVIVVDLFGNMPDYDLIKNYCDSQKIILIEDAAEALGSSYKGRKAGSFGVGSTFSFHRTKTITTGEGGMLLLDDHILYERCKFLRDHGRAPGTYFNTEVTYKYMPFNVQAALGYAQFQRLEELVDKKRWIWKGFVERLKDLPDIILNPEPSYVVNGVWATALIIGKSYNLSKEVAMNKIEKFGAPVRPFFYPLTSLPAFDIKEAKFRNLVAYDISSRGINLPCALNLTEYNLDQYSKIIIQVLNNHNE